MLSSLATSNYSMPASVDRATQGSRRQLQEYIQRLPRYLNQEIERLLPPELQALGQHPHWLSTQDSDQYQLGPRADFLRAAGLSPQPSLVDRRWARLGNCWNGLGLLPQGRGARPGLLLVESRSRLEEIDEPGWRLPARSSQLIHETLRETQQWLNAAETDDWTGPLYRTANQLAHLHLLRNHMGVPAWLVQVYFLNDPAGPASRADWLPVIAGAQARLGFSQRPPFTLEVFLPALHPA